MYLIDTVVLSELRKRDRHPGVLRWLRGKAEDALFLSAVTIGEIERGVARQRVADAEASYSGPGSKASASVTAWTPRSATSIPPQ